jgi:hypothetical protein
MSGQITPPKIACLRQKSIHLNQVTRNRTPVISQGSGIAERNAPRLQQVLSIAYEIDNLDRLRKSGSITQDEFVRLRAKLVA